MRVVAAACLLVVALALLAGARPGAAAAERVETPFSDEELVRGFVLTVFGSEVPGGRDGHTARVVKKFTGPVSYRLVSTARKDWRPTVRSFLMELSGTVDNLTLGETSREDADLVIYLVDRADYAATIRRTAWAGVNTGFMEANACSAVIRARTSGIETAHIYLVADEGFLSLSHCMVEEVAQSLGPANDSTLLPDSIFNDRSPVNVFGVFDWFILNMLYDPRIRPGMTEEEVLPLLPAVIADVRARLPEVLARDDALHHHMFSR